MEQIAAGGTLWNKEDVFGSSLDQVDADDPLCIMERCIYEYLRTNKLTQNNV